MAGRIFNEREHAIEASYFHRQDEKLLKALRRDATLDEIGAALAEQLLVDNADLLVRVRELGITADTAAAFLLAPLVQVAWAAGRVSRRARSAVLGAALAGGIGERSPSHDQLLEWLRERPSPALFDTALEVISYGLAALPPSQREGRIARIIRACSEVASRSGSALARMIGGTFGFEDAASAAASEIARSLRPSPALFESTATGARSGKTPTNGKIRGREIRGQP